MGEEIVVDDFDKAFAEVAAQAERTPEQVEADAKTAEEAAAKAALAAETPEAKLAREAAEKAAADAEAKTKADAEAAAVAAALAAETPEAKLAREASEKTAADAAAKVKADADAAAKVKADADAAAAVAAAAVETPEAKATREKFEESIKPYEPSAEEKTAMEKFKVDFPNEAVAIEARLKGVDREINSRIYAAVQSIVKNVDPRLAAVESTTVNDAAERHFSALRTAHTDYDAVIAKVPDWIKTQPTYLQPAMQATFESGTTQDVLALVADYKKAAGISTTDVGAADAAAKAKAAADAAAAAKAKAAADAASLEPVGTRRTTAGPKGKADPQDFDGAWAELAAAAQ